MADLQAVQLALDAYHNTYRHPELSRLQLSKPYALFPDAPSRFELSGQWPDDYWPNVNSPGVYLIFDATLDLLYIGKTSLDFGSRLAEYFQYEKSSRRCKIVEPEQWKAGPPAYVSTVPVQAPFEAASLEEYLIQELCPSDNSVGKRKAVKTG